MSYTELRIAITLFGMASGLFAAAFATAAAFCVKPGYKPPKLKWNPLNGVFFRDLLTPRGLRFRRLSLFGCLGFIASMVAHAVLGLIVLAIR